MIWMILSLVFFLMILVLAWKIFLLKSSVRKIGDDLSEILKEETNTLITVSSSDRDVLRLAKTLNEQLRVLRKEQLRLEDGNHELQNAITNISHDLRTPLTTIRGYLELLEREEMSPKAKQYFSVIRERSDALTALSEELFRFSVISATSDELRPESVDVSDILEESIAGFYTVLTEKHIDPVISLTDRPVIRDLDKAALRRIFDNLLSNAVKYSDGDLSVTLTEDGMVTFSNTASKLDPLAVGRLFDRFYTVESGRGSTGLGLSIAKLLTERMGGTISADYQNGKILITLTL